MSTPISLPPFFRFELHRIEAEGHPNLLTTASLQIRKFDFGKSPLQLDFGTMSLRLSVNQRTIYIYTISKLNGEPEESPFNNT